MKARRARGLALVVAAFAALGHAGSLGALEVDPYHAWQQEIEDSADLLNAFLAESFAESIELANQRPGRFATCPDVSRLLMRRVFSSVFGRKPVFRFIGRLPPRYKAEGGHFSEVWRSPYRYVPQLYFSSLAETINVDGVYLGKDKITHVFGFGRRYYSRYLRARERGLSAEEAVAEAVARGMKQEAGWVGGRIDGIFSYADLESNYRGLQLARSLCEDLGGGDALDLSGGPGSWRLVGVLDIRDVVNPLFDEGYNTPRMVSALWPGVRLRLRRFCTVLELPEVRQRLERYDARIESLDSPSEELIAELSTDRQRARRRQHSIFTLCALDTGSPATLPATGVSGPIGEDRRR